jgi:hypothetical protein
VGYSGCIGRSFWACTSRSPVTWGSTAHDHVTSTNIWSSFFRSPAKSMVQMRTASPARTGR